MRVYGKRVGSSLESTEWHTEKHGLGLSIDEYLAVGDALTGGREWKFSGKYNGRKYTVVIRGMVWSPTPLQTEGQQLCTDC